MGEGANKMRVDDRDDINRIDRDDVVIRDTGDTGAYSADDETTEIRADIEQTRAEMSETIEAIQERLNPTNIKEQVKEQVKEHVQEAKEAVREATIGKAEDMVRNAGETAREARYTIAETIRQNPIPAAMVGIGLAWLFMNRSSTSSRGAFRYADQGRYVSGQTYYTGRRGYQGSPAYYDYERDYQGGVVQQGQRAVGEAVSRVQETTSTVASRAQETASTVASRAQETASNVASRAQETASTVASRAQETVENLADQAQYQAQRVEDRFQQTLYQSPLAVGAVALALGTAVGLALPETRREHELMGEARDNLVEKAQGVAQDTIEKVQRVAEQVIDTAQTTAKEEAQNQGLTTE